MTTTMMSLGVPDQRDRRASRKDQKDPEEKLQADHLRLPRVKEKLLDLHAHLNRHDRRARNQVGHLEVETMTMMMSQGVPDQRDRRANQKDRKEKRLDHLQ